MHDNILPIRNNNCAELPPHKMEHPLDDLDRAILEAHQRDPSFLYSELAEEFEVTTATVRNRIKRLKGAGVMDLILVLNPYKLGFHTLALIGIRVDWDRASDKEVATDLEALPNIVSVMVVAGRFDIFARCICADLESYRRFISEDLRSIDGISHFESFIELDLHNPKVEISTLKGTK